MIQFRAFEVLIEIISGARQRQTREHQDFLQFYQELVKIVPAEIAKDFNSIQAPTISKGKVNDTYRLELTVADYLWWNSIINDEGGRFAQGVSTIQREIWDRLTKLINKATLTPEEQDKFLNIMTQTTSTID